MATINDMLETIKIPQVIKVRQRFDDTVLESYPQVLMERLRAKDIDIKPGQRICITGGSRGIVGYQALMKTIVDFLLENETMSGQQFADCMAGKEIGEAQETTIFDSVQTEE